VTRLAPALIALALSGLVGTAAAQSTPAKKDLVQRILRAQQGDLEAMARNLVEQPAGRMMQEAGLAMQQMQFPQEKFQSTGKQIEAEVRKYVDDALPIVRERAIKIAPSTIGVALETKMSEDELRQLLAWLESPASKKFQQVTSEASSGFAQQVTSEARPLVQPKLVALDGRIRGLLGVPPAGSAPAAGSGPGAASAPRGKPPGK
jgi:hypothetical protein